MTAYERLPGDRHAGGYCSRPSLLNRRLNKSGHPLSPWLRAGGARAIKCGLYLHPHFALEFWEVSTGMRFAMSALSANRMAAGLMLSALVSSTFAARADDVEYSRIGWWSISYTKLDDLSYCRAMAPFEHGTVLEMALFQKGGQGWVLSISNPEWKAWMLKKRRHDLKLESTSAWRGPFSLSDDKTSLVAGASIDLINSIADAKSLELFDENDRLLTSLDMKDSAAAIRAVVKCVREPPSVPSPEAEKTGSSGTGFFVAPNLLITNNHVVRECTTPVQVRYPEKVSYTATPSGQDKANDLILLHTQMPNLSVASFRSQPQPRLGERVAAYGFPYSAVLSPNFTLGNITALSGPMGDTRFLQTSAPIQPGNSGGPLLDMSGRVVGVVIGQLKQTDSQNVNFAIQTPILVNFLNVKGVRPNEASNARTQNLPEPDIADMAMKFTVQVYCQGVSPKVAE